MALNPLTRYPGQIAPASPGHPYGAAQNVTVSGDGTGTPWELDNLNDIFGDHQAALAAMGQDPSGDPDEVGASQYLLARAVSVRTRAQLLVADLEADSGEVGAEASQRVVTQGYYVPGDGGGAVYVIKTAAQAAADGDVLDSWGSEALVNGNVAVVDPIGGWVSAKQYGARADVTTTNDAPALMALIAAQKNVLVNDGVMISEPVVVSAKHNRTIRLLGSVYRDDSVAAFNELFDFEDCEGLDVGGGIIDGSALLDQGTPANLYRAMSVDDCPAAYIHDITIRRITSGLYASSSPNLGIILSTSTDAHFERLIFDNNIGSGIQGNGMTVDQCRFVNWSFTGTPGIGVIANGSTCVTRCEFAGWLQHGVGASGDHLTVRDNQFRDFQTGTPGGHLVLGILKPGNTRSSNLVIRQGRVVGNTFQADGPDAIAGIDVQDADGTVVIAENSFADLEYSPGILFSGEEHFSDGDVVITGNSFLRNLRGIAFEWGIGTLVAGNNFRDQLLSAIWVTNDLGSPVTPTDMVISENVFRDNWTGGTSGPVGPTGGGPAVYVRNISGGGDGATNAYVFNNVFFREDAAASSDQVLGIAAEGSFARLWADGNVFSYQYEDDEDRYRAVSSPFFFFVGAPIPGDMGAESGSIVLDFATVGEQASHQGGKWTAVQIGTDVLVTDIIWPVGSRKFGTYQIDVLQPAGGGQTFTFDTGLVDGSSGTLGAAADQRTLIELRRDRLGVWAIFTPLT